jgi:hypothetical protein
MDKTPNTAVCTAVQKEIYKGRWNGGRNKIKRNKEGNKWKKGENTHTNEEICNKKLKIISPEKVPKTQGKYNYFAECYRSRQSRVN